MECYDEVSSYKVEIGWGEGHNYNHITKDRDNEIICEDDVSIYETFNNGAWYNIGFILGIAIFFGGSGRSSKGKCR